MKANRSIVIPNYGKLVICLTIFVMHSITIFAQDKKAIIELNFQEENDIKNIIAKASEFENDSIGAPIEELDLNFYVQRTFSLLPIGGRFNTTDENGVVTIEFPNDLPGDSTGNITLIVKIEDADEYADTSVSKDLNWGIPVAIDHNENARTLYAASANAPITLMILTNSLIAIAWGIMFYVLIKIYQISKM